MTLPYRMTLVLIIALSSSFPALAEERTVEQRELLTLIVGERTWISSGKTDFNIAGSGGVPNVVSELKWNHLHSTVVELNADALWVQRIITKLDLGFGGIGHGKLTDSDYMGNNRTLLVSESVSNVENGKLWYVNLDAGYRAWTSDTKDMIGRPRVFIDMLLGYQHWSEKYEASAGIQTQPPFGPFPDQGVGLTETFTWDSIRIGGRGNVGLVPALALRAKAYFIPWTHFTLKDIHHFRPDLAQNPSLKATTNGGLGGQFDVTLVYNTMEALSVEVGYQYWYTQSGSGTGTFFLLTAAPRRYHSTGRIAHETACLRESTLDSRCVAAIL